MAPQNVLVELFADFIRLRQVGYAPEAAWQALRPRIARLGEEDVTRLHVLLRGWEAREGRHYQVAAALNATPEHSDERIERVRTSVAPLPEGIGESTLPSRPKTLEIQPGGQSDEGYAAKKHLIRRIAPTTAEPPTPNVVEGDGLCPVCFRTNQPGDMYCVHCGYRLTDQGDAVAGYPGTAQPMPFTAGMVIQIKVRGASEVLRLVPVENKTIIVGRAAADSVTKPDVDLTPFSAQSFGVSRLHAGLTWQDGSIILHDMGSLNYTFLNGQRLHSHEQRVITDGDEVRLGHLIMHLYFRRES